MLAVSALALGPLLARVAPRLADGLVENSTAVTHWLSEQFTDPASTLVPALKRSTDRAWRSLQVALAGDRLLALAAGTTPDRALVEQLRQFIAVEPLPLLDPSLRQRLGSEIVRAREQGLIPGTVPSHDALAAAVMTFLSRTDDELMVIEGAHLQVLAGEMRSNGFETVAAYLEQAATTSGPLLTVAARFFFAREILGHLVLLRDLRSDPAEMLPEHVQRGFGRLADAFDRFTGPLTEMLTKLADEGESTAGEPPPQPPQEHPALPASGFAIHGTHLVSPIELDDVGTRVSPCPVCLTRTILPPSAAPWVLLRCDSCGTEFRASDGSAPPPPDAEKKSADNPESVQAFLAKRNLQRWIDAGEPEKWVERLKGVVPDEKFKLVIETLRYSRFWPLDEAEVRRTLLKRSRHFREKVVSSKRSSEAGPATGPAEPTAPRGLIHTSDVYRTIDGNCWVPCPLCRSFNVEIPPRAVGVIRLNCSGCGRMFAVDLKKKTDATILPPPPPPPPPGVWEKFRKWFSS